MSTYLPETEVDTRKPWQLIKDIWWRTCTKTGHWLNAKIVRWGTDGKPDGETTPATELGYTRANFKTVNEKLDRIAAKLGA